MAVDRNTHEEPPCLPLSPLITFHQDKWIGLCGSFNLCKGTSSTPLETMMMLFLITTCGRRSQSVSQSLSCITHPNSSFSISVVGNQFQIIQLQFPGEDEVSSLNLANKTPPLYNIESNVVQEIREKCRQVSYHFHRISLHWEWWTSRRISWSVSVCRVSLHPNLAARVPFLLKLLTDDWPKSSFDHLLPCKEEDVKVDDDHCTKP